MIGVFLRDVFVHNRTSAPNAPNSTFNFERSSALYRRSHQATPLAETEVFSVGFLDHGETVNMEQIDEQLDEHGKASNLVGNNMSSS